MQGQNLFLTTDKYSAVSFGFDKNTWSLYEDGKIFVLSVGPKYSYDFLYNAMEGIDDDRVELIVKAVIGDRMELLSADEYCFILDHTDEYLERARRVANRVVSNRDFLSEKDDNPYISVLNFSTVHLNVGEGLFDFLYADFDTAYEQCKANIKKDSPKNLVSLDINELSEEEKKLYYYVCMAETARLFRPLIEASFFSAAFPPIVFEFTESSLSEYYQYLKTIQKNLMELFRYAYDENFAEGILNCFSHRTRYAIYCKKNGLSTERRRTITRNISISEAENAVQNVTEGYIDYNYELDALIDQANLNNYDEDLTKKVEAVGITMADYIALLQYEAEEYETVECENIEQALELEFLQLLKNESNIRQCKRCGKYFIMKGNYDTNYCDRIAEGETRNCQDIAAQENYKKKMADNAAIPLYQKYYKRYAARVRSRQIKEPDFKKWKYEAMTKRNECTDKKITVEEYENWLEGSFPNRNKKKE